LKVMGRRWLAAGFRLGLELMVSGGWLALVVYLLILFEPL
jgi:hypothetical protein